MDFQIFLKHQLTPHGSNHLSWITDASLIANNTDASKCHTLFEELHIYSTNLTLRTLCKAGAVILLPTDENPEAPAGPALTPVGPTRSGRRVLAPHNCSLSLCLPQSPPGPLRSLFATCSVPQRTTRTPTSASHPGQRQRHPSGRSAPTLRSRPSPLPPPRLRAARSRVAGQFGSAPATALRRHCQHPCSCLFCRLVYSDGLPHGLPASALVYLSYNCQRDVFSIK